MPEAGQGFLARTGMWSRHSDLNRGPAVTKWVGQKGLGVEKRSVVRVRRGRAWRAGLGPRTPGMSAGAEPVFECQLVEADEVEAAGRDGVDVQVLVRARVGQQVCQGLAGGEAWLVKLEYAGSA